MDHLTWRPVAILAALVSASSLMGASLYEKSVPDLVWPLKPWIVRPMEDGANRRLLWLPADLIASTSLLVARTWAAWPAAGTRYVGWPELPSMQLILQVSVAYFVPELLKGERNGTRTDDPASRTWLRRNRGRAAIFVCTAIARGCIAAWPQLAGRGRTRRSALREAQGNLSSCVSDSGSIGKNKCSRIG